MGNYEFKLTTAPGVPLDLLALGPLPNSRACDGEVVAFEKCEFANGNIDTQFNAEPISLAQFAYVSAVASVAIGAVSGNGRNMLALAAFTQSVEQDPLPAPAWYDFQNHVQCDVAFRPRRFRVDADATQRLINVTDIGAADEGLIDPTVGDGTFASGQGILAQMVMRQTMVLSASLTTLYYSAVGEGLW